ncbi:MAG TPA: hypothetical protein VKQ36_17220 [Ktedonobacterales bacterium]|nr:hypothetical protein [Ktedonobacterales bacterium]
MTSQTLTTGIGGVTVVVTETSVTVIQPGGRKQETFQRASITSVELKTILPSVFGMGGSKQVIIHTNDRRHITLNASPKHADAIAAALR